MGKSINIVPGAVLQGKKNRRQKPVTSRRKLHLSALRGTFPDRPETGALKCDVPYNNKRVWSFKQHQFCTCTRVYLMYIYMNLVFEKYLKLIHCSFLIGRVYCMYSYMNLIFGKVLKN